MITRNYNKNFFEQIDSEAKAYWLGFICADGYINQRGNTLGISLDKKDEKHLLKFLQDINAVGVNITYTVSKYSKEYRETEKAHVRLFSKKMVNDLKKLGITNKKSKDLKELNIQFSSELLPHFIRGYFDGDGCVFESLVKRKNKTYYTAGVTFVGTFEFLTFINDNLPFKVKKLNYDKRTSSSYTLYACSKKRILSFYNFCYKDITVFLRRKYEKINKIINKIEGSSETTICTSH